MNINNFNQDNTNPNKQIQLPTLDKPEPASTTKIQYNQFPNSLSGVAVSLLKDTELANKLRKDRSNNIIKKKSKNHRISFRDQVLNGTDVKDV